MTASATPATPGQEWLLKLVLHGRPNRALGRTRDLEDGLDGAS